MLKSDLVRILAEKNEELTYREVDTIITSVLDEIGNALSSGESG